MRPLARRDFLKIDVYNHILPRAYYDRMMAMSDRGAYMMKRVSNIPMLYDLDARFRKIDQFGDDYKQVFSLNLPPVEAVFDRNESPEMARVANDGMAEVVAKYPDRFPGFVAALPLNNMDAAMDEIDRSVNQLGAKGVQVFSNVNGRPMDEPEFLPLFQKMAELDLPVWIHPTRSADFADYVTENRSKYDLWWAFGWPYETSIFMGRLVMSGLFDKLPDLKIITHHLGAMLPYFEMRAGPGLDQLGTRSDDPEDNAVLGRLKKRPYDYFRMFYADTAVFGSIPATECGLAFFGSDHVLFASDAPFDPEGGSGYIRETLRVIDGITCSIEDRQKIYEGNARRLLKL
jgi:predicted TIM-barrel fold metal-dependent hydrolase